MSYFVAINETKSLLWGERPQDQSLLSYHLSNALSRNGFDHKTDRSSTNRQRQKLSTAVFEAAH